MTRTPLRVSFSFLPWVLFACLPALVAASPNCDQLLWIAQSGMPAPAVAALAPEMVPMAERRECHDNLQAKLRGNDPAGAAAERIAKGQTALARAALADRGANPAEPLAYPMPPVEQEAARQVQQVQQGTELIISSEMIHASFAAAVKEDSRKLKEAIAKEFERATTEALAHALRVASQTDAGLAAELAKGKVAVDRIRERYAKDAWAEEFRRTALGAVPKDLQKNAILVIDKVVADGLAKAIERAPIVVEAERAKALTTLATYNSELALLSKTVDDAGEAIGQYQRKLTDVADQARDYVDKRRTELESHVKELERLRGLYPDFETSAATEIKKAKDTYARIEKDLRSASAIVKRVSEGQVTSTEVTTLFMDGAFAALPPDKREVLQLSIKTVSSSTTGFQGGASKVVAGGAAAVAVLGAVFGDNNPEVKNLAKNVQTAQQVLAVASAFATGGPVGAVMALAGGGGLGGLGGGDNGEAAAQARHAEIMGALSKLLEGQQKILKELAGIRELQEQTLKKLGELSIQVEAARVDLANRIDAVHVDVRKSQAVLEQVLAGVTGYNQCIEFTRPQFTSFSGRRSNVELRSQNYYTCINNMIPHVNENLRQGRVSGLLWPRDKITDPQLQATWYTNTVWAPIWRFTRGNFQASQGMGGLAEQAKDRAVYPLGALPPIAFPVASVPAAPKLQFEEGGGNQVVTTTDLVADLLVQPFHVEAVRSMTNLALGLVPYCALMPSSGSKMVEPRDGMKPARCASNAPQGGAPVHAAKKLLDLVVAHDVIVSGEFLVEQFALPLRSAGRRVIAPEYDKSQWTQIGYVEADPLRICERKTAHPEERYWEAACVLERNPVARTNVLRHLIRSRLAQPKDNSTKPRGTTFSYYISFGRTGDKNLSDLLDLPIVWRPLSEGGQDGTHHLQVRVSDGNIAFWPLPSPSEIISGRVEYPPAFYAHLAQRQRLNEMSAAFRVPEAEKPGLGLSAAVAALGRSLPK